MKKLIYLFLFLAGSTTFINCGDDEEDCVAPALSQNIIGFWNTAGEEVEFKADGTLLDPGHGLLDVKIFDVQLTEKTYSINADTLTIRGESPDGQYASWDDHTLVKNECNLIQLDFQGFPTLMSRQE